MPRSDMPGEVTWPTQPFPSNPPPFARQSFTVKDLNPFMEREEKEQLRKEMEGARNQGLFTPPGLTNTVEMPGNNGGANFQGAAVDPEHGMLFVVSKDLPSMLRLELNPTEQVAAGNSPEEKGSAVYQTNCRLCHGADLAGQPPALPSLSMWGRVSTADQIRATVVHGRGPMPAFAGLSDASLDSLVAYLLHPERASEPFDRGTAPRAETTLPPEKLRYRSSFGFMFTNSGLPAIAPPWTTLTAYDLNQGTIQWQLPLGEVPELAAKGITNTGSHFPKVGPVVTAGGLIFTGTRDKKVRALDSASGKVLWEKEAGAALEGMPAVYAIDGREYVVFCAAAQATTHTHDCPATRHCKLRFQGLISCSRCLRSQSISAGNHSPLSFVTVVCSDFGYQDLNFCTDGPLCPGRPGGTMNDSCLSSLREAGGNCVRRCDFAHVPRSDRNGEEDRPGSAAACGSCRRFA